MVLRTPAWVSSENRGDNEMTNDSSPVQGPKSIPPPIHKAMSGCHCVSLFRECN